MAGVPLPLPHLHVGCQRGQQGQQLRARLAQPARAAAVRLLACAGAYHVLGVGVALAPRRPLAAPLVQVHALLLAREG